MHVYLNGVYHGQYQVMERPNHHFHGAYLGGDDEDYHYTNSSRNGSDHGGGDTWNVTWTAIKNSLSSMTGAARRVDFENLIDYMILNYYTGNDWDWSYNHNWMAGGPKSPDRGGGSSTPGTPTSYCRTSPIITWTDRRPTGSSTL